MKTSTSYCLQSKENQALFYLASHRNAGANAYYLTLVQNDEKPFPLFTTKTPEKMALFLQSASSHLSFDSDRPSLSREAASDAVIVEVAQTITPLAIEVPPPLTIITWAKKIPLILRKYAKEEVREDFSVFAVIEMPDGETIDSLQRFKGKSFVRSDSSDWCTLGNIFEVPEEYEELLKGLPGFAAAIKWTDFQAI